MARTDTLTNYLTDVADAIREKSGKTAKIPAANYDTEIAAIVDGIDIENGSTKRYSPRGDAIVQNSFVSTSTGAHLASLQPSEFPHTSVRGQRVIRLSDTETLIIGYDTNSTYGKAEATVGILNLYSTDLVTYSPSTPVVFATGAVSQLTGIALSSTKVLIFYRMSSGTYYTICTISAGTGINRTLSFSDPVSFNIGLSDPTGLVLLSSTSPYKVLILGRRGSYTYLSGCVCTIDGSNVTFSTVTQLANKNSTGSTYVNSILVSSSSDTHKVFVSCANGDAYNLAGIILTISGTTITAGTLTSIREITRPSDSSYYTPTPLLFKISNEKIGVMHILSHDCYRVIGLVINISGTSIGTITESMIGMYENTASNYYGILYSGSDASNLNTTLPVLWTVCSEKDLTGTTKWIERVFTIENDVLKRQVEQTFFINNIRGVTETNMTSNKLFVVYGNTTSTYGYILKFGDMLKATEGEKIIGINPTLYDEGSANYIDITSYSGTTPTYTESVTLPYTVTNAYASNPYEFVLGDDGYYESNNQGVSKSWAVSKVSFTNNTGRDVGVVVQFIDYAKTSDDNYGMLSSLDETFGGDYWTEDYCFYDGYNTSSSSTVKNVTYVIPTGTHYFTVKYRRYGSTTTSLRNDSFKFKIVSFI